MKKFILALICAFIIAGVPNTGHAFLFGGGGGGGHRKNSGHNTVVLSSLFNFDFHQFGVKQRTIVPGQNSSDPDPLKYYCNLPYLGTYPYGANRDDVSSIINDFDSDWDHYGGNVESGYVAQKNSPVPETATVMLLGIGLIALAPYVRRKFSN